MRPDRVVNIIGNAVVDLSRLFRLIQTPPPWFWGAEGRIWQRPGQTSGPRLVLELIQQLHHWLKFPSRWRRFSTASLHEIPWPLIVQACWLNSYRPAELAWWWATGERSWARLCRHAPDSLVGALHAQRRLTWPEQCRPALRLLGDKAALLDCTPERWRPSALLLGNDRVGQEAPLQPTPSWWDGALRGKGLVLKPQRGHAGRGVIRFRWTDNGLQQEALFRQLPDGSPSMAVDAPPEPRALLEHWQRLCGGNEPALAAPYLSHSLELPATEPSVVMRVITAQASMDAAVAIHQAWLEVPLGQGSVAFLSVSGAALPHPGRSLAACEQAALKDWQQRLGAEPPACLGAVLEAARAMHALLPPIDQVAWDWIPAEPEPMLLEGNGGFGMLVPQLWDHSG